MSEFDDDYPSTHLDDEEYDAFLKREIGRDGTVRDGPPVVQWIIGAIVVIAVVALFLFT